MAPPATMSPITAARTESLGRLVSIASLALLATALLAFGWDRGPDILIDFGRELYVPWRLVEGDHLHTDIAWFNGPAAPWILEGWMRVFGVSLDALQALNALVLLATLALLVSLVRQFADALSAWAAGVVFLAVFAVAQQEATGNFLFLTPYSHGITFGFLFGVGALHALVRAARGPGWWPPLVCGVCCGLAFLTKAEITLAVGAAVAVGLGAALVSGSTEGRRRRLVGFCALGAALPLVAAFARFAQQLGLDGAWRAMTVTWAHALDGRVSDLEFYREMRGMDDPALHLARMARVAAGSGALIAALMLGALQVEARVTSQRLAVALPFVAAGTVTLGVLFLVHLKWLLVPLPLVIAPVLVLAVRRWLRARHADPDESSAALAQLVFVVLAAGLLPKILLQSLARQYGFVLSLPGTLLIVVVLVLWLPRALASRFGASGHALPALRAVGLAIVLAFTAANFNATRNYFLDKTFSVGDAGDRILAEGWRGTVMAALIQQIDARLEPGGTLLVLPEGIIVNYLLRARTPTPVVNFMPPELIFFDEARIIAALEANPPDVVALVHRKTEVYGYPFFGEGYGEAILAWVRERYERVLSIGGEPFEGDDNGAAVLMPR